MNKDVATIVLATCLRCAREIGDLQVFIEQNCSIEEYSRLKTAIGGVVFDIMNGIGGVALEDNPELRTDTENRILQYGRAF